MELLALALAVGLGVEARRITVLVGSLYLPLLVAVGILFLVTSGRRHPAANRAATFCDGVASDLRAGLSLAHSVASAAAAVGADSLVEASRERRYAELAAVAADEFPTVGRELAVTLAGAAHTGGSAADLFDEIASLAIAHQELRREVRVAAAPARAAASILLAGPVLYLGWRWASGSLGSLLLGPDQRVVGMFGVALLLFGLLGVGAVMWRAR